MVERAAARAAFLASVGWSDATRVPLAGDASGRRYDRLTRATDGAGAVLMDAPPDTCGDIAPFRRIDEILRARGFSAPAIHASDPTCGFLLLEDLGDDLFARVIDRDPTRAHELYAAATDVLLALRTAPPAGLMPANTETLCALTDLAFSHYRTGAGAAIDPATQRHFQSLFGPLLRRATNGPDILMLRDFHAENLIWLPDRDGISRVGLLDFQDAMTGPPVYDLVSLLQDARRDVPVSIEDAMIARYLRESGEDSEGFRAAYAIIGVQRHLRILGVFARLARDFGKPGYIDLIPRTWAHLMRDLDHPALRPVAKLLRDALPEPDTATLDRLKAGNR